MTTSTSLLRQLENGAVRCGLTEDQSARFLPQSLVDSLITKANITPTLPWLQRVCPPWSSASSLVDKIHSRARKVFAVLALIGHESKIGDLIDDGITDQDLPLHQVPGPDPGESVIVSKNKTGETCKEFPSFKSFGIRVVRDFLDKQWHVLAPVLDSPGTHLELDPRCPLPIEGSSLKVRAHGVFIYQASLHPAHQLWPHDGKSASLVAIKEIHYEDVFAREWHNLKKIKGLQHPHLVELLASCQKGSFRCFIFPWASGGDLWNFWKDKDQSPRTRDSVLWMLEQVLGLVDAIRAMHEKNIRHGDIKPQNILHFTGPVEKYGKRGRLVLADLGVSKFHGEHSTGLRNAPTDTVEVTILYEAPEAEYDRRKKLPRSRRYDMWSSGCMLLEFIVWLLYGFNAVDTFRSRRLAVSKDDPITPPGSFFQKNSKGHFKINPMVLRAMEILRKDPRCQQGTTLAELLTLIDGRLLQIDPKKRAEATELHSTLQGIVNKAQACPEFVWQGSDPSPEIPKFFARSTRRGVRKFSDSSEASSSGSVVSIVSSESSALSSGWSPRGTNDSLVSVASMESRDEV